MSKLGEIIANFRQDYKRDVLDEQNTTAIPLAQFEQWLQQAIDLGQPEPNAMTLATVDSEQKPSTRVVLLKGFDQHGLQFFTNYESRKGQQLALNPNAALQFYWPILEKVIRIEGQVSKLTAQASDTYFASRPLDSRIGAWASKQSQPINSRLSIVQQATKYATKFGTNPPRPPHWGGYLFVPQYWEFWQGRNSRLHDRICYQLQKDGSWHKQRLAP